MGPFPSTKDCHLNNQPPMVEPSSLINEQGSPWLRNSSLRSLSWLTNFLLGLHPLAWYRKFPQKYHIKFILFECHSYSCNGESQRHDFNDEESSTKKYGMKNIPVGIFPRFCTVQAFFFIRISLPEISTYFLSAK